MAEKKVMLSNHVDLPLLQFLWQWKLLTMTALVKKFYPESAPNTAYKRLMILKNTGVIQRVPVYSDQGFLWSLTAKGFNVIKNSIPELREDGYRSENVEHDFLVTAVHLGEWLLEQPENAETFSEQQLRRFAFEHYPEWVPTPLTEELVDHRPDGYWRVSIGEQFHTIALEVELNQKRNSAYEKVAKFYKEEKKVDRVLWVVPSTETAKTLQSKMSQFDNERSNIHDFVILKHFLESGWSAKIHSGPECGETLENLFLQNRGKLGVKQGIHFSSKLLLDTRKTPSFQKVTKAATSHSKATDYGIVP